MLLRRFDRFCRVILLPADSSIFSLSRCVLDDGLGVLPLAGLLIFVLAKVSLSTTRM